MCAQRRLRSAWAFAQSDQSSLSAWSKLGSLATHWAHSEDYDQTGRMPRLIWVFAGRTVILVVLLWGGSYLLHLECKYRDTDQPFEKIRLTQLIILTTHQTLYNPSIIKITITLSALPASMSVTDNSVIWQEVTFNSLPQQSNLTTTL